MIFYGPELEEALNGSEGLQITRVILRAEAPYITVDIHPTDNPLFSGHENEPKDFVNLVDWVDPQLLPIFTNKGLTEAVILPDRCDLYYRLDATSHQMFEATHTILTTLYSIADAVNAEVFRLIRCTNARCLSIVKVK